MPVPNIKGKILTMNRLHLSVGRKGIFTQLPPNTTLLVSTERNSKVGILTAVNLLTVSMCDKKFYPQVHTQTMPA